MTNNSNATVRDTDFDKEHGKVNIFLIIRIKTHNRCISFQISC